MLKYIKWIAALIWVAIYQLPARRIGLIAHFLALSCLALVIWITNSNAIVLGDIRNITELSDQARAMVEVHPAWSRQNHLAIIDAETADLINTDDPIWFFAYGKESHSLYGEQLVVADYHTTYSNWVISGYFERLSLEALLPDNPNLVIALGIGTLIFGTLLLQLISAVLLTALAVFSCWHALHLGNAHAWWSISDLLIIQACILVSVAVLALGLRLKQGWLHFILIRLGALVLQVLFIASIQSLFGLQKEWTYFLFAAVFILPHLSIVVIAAVLLSVGFGLDVVHGAFIVMALFLLYFWVRGYLPESGRLTARPFSRKPVHDNGHLKLNTLFRGL